MPAENNLQKWDLLFTGKKAQGLVSYAIKFGTWLRYRESSPYSHVASVIEVRDTVENSLVIEATGSGVDINRIGDRFPNGDYDILSLGRHIHPHDSGQLMSFAQSVLQEKGKQGAKIGYGVGTFVGLGFYCLTGTKWCIQKAGTAICSGLVCDMYRAAGYNWERPPYAMMPYDIAKHFDFHPVQFDPV